MGNVTSMVVRKARRFNVENRAQRVLDQDKPTAAPKFESNVRDLQKVLDENPEWVQEQGKKSIALDDRLKQVYVTSNEPESVPRVRPGTEPETSAEPQAGGEATPRALPLDRKAVDDFEYGYKEPVKVSRGRTTLRQAIHFIGEHQKEPEAWTAKRIADEYKLKESIVVDILHNFHTFEFHIPDTKTTENVLISKPNNKLLGVNAVFDAKSTQPSDCYDTMEDQLTGGKLKK